MANGVPLASFTFSVEIQGIVEGIFKECSGVGSEHEVIEFHQSDDKGHDIIKKIPGKLKWDNISLKRGVTTSMKIWQWREDIVNGKVEEVRKNGTITLHAQGADNPVAQWEFIEAWPSKVSGPTFNTETNEIGIEEMVLAHHGIKRVM